MVSATIARAREQQRCAASFTALLSFIHNKRCGSSNRRFEISNNRKCLSVHSFHFMIGREKRKRTKMRLTSDILNYSIHTYVHCTEYFANNATLRDFVGTRSAIDHFEMFIKKSLLNFTSNKFRDFKLNLDVYVCIPIWEANCLYLVEFMLFVYQYAFSFFLQIHAV